MQYFPRLKTPQVFLWKRGSHQASLNVSAAVDSMHFLLPGRAGRQRKRLRAPHGLAQAAFGGPRPPRPHVDRPVSLPRAAAADPPPRLSHIQAQLMLMSPTAAEIQRSSQQPQHVNGAPFDSQNRTRSIHLPEGEFLPLIYEQGSSQQFQADGLKPETLCALANTSNLQ